MSKLNSIFSLNRLAIVLFWLCGTNIQHGQSQDATPEICKDAIHVCGNLLNGLQGTLPDTNTNDIIWPNFIFPGTGVCGLAGEFNNTIWYSFVTCDTTVHLRIFYNNCVQPQGITADAGIQLGLYSKCKHTSSVTCGEAASSTSGIIELKYDKFIPGELAFLVLDGYSSSVCDFRIEVIKGIDTTPPIRPDTTLLSDGAITGPNVINCQTKGQPIRYNLTKPGCKINLPPSCVSTVSTSPNGIDSIKYVWSVTPSTGRSIANIDSSGSTKEITFTELGTYTLEARAVFHPAYGGKCENGGCGKIQKWIVEVKEADTIQAPLIVLCPDSTATYCGQLITRDTTVLCQLNACDIEEQSFIFEKYIDTDLGKQTVCKGNSYLFQGQLYTPGSYIVKDNLNCKKRFVFNVEEIELEVNISSASSLLTCFTKEISINGNAITNGTNAISYSWYNSSNALVGTNNSLIVSSPGDYKLDVAYTISTTNVCQKTATITITQDTETPKITALIPKLTCKNSAEPDKRITIASNISLVAAEWKTPTGGIFSGTSITVDSASVLLGTPFSFHGVASNGCVVDTAISVPYNFKKPNISVEGNILTCRNPLTKLTMSSDIAWDSIRWSFSDGNTVNFIAPNGPVTSDQDKVGTYTALVRAAESLCFSSGSKVISEDKLLPSVDLGLDLKWNCNTTNINLKPVVVDIGPSFKYNWTAINSGSISGNNLVDNVLISTPGSYVLSISNTTNGCQNKDTIHIERETNIPTNINLIAQDISCYGLKDGAITLVNVDGGILPIQYTLNGQTINGNDVLENLNAGTYTLSVKDKFDCSYSQIVNLIEPQELTIGTTSSFDLEYEDNVALQFSSSYDLNELAFISWVDKNGTILGSNPTLDYVAIQNDEILITIKNENGCTVSTRIKIYVDNELKVFLPNVFSPNGDGANDRFTIFKNKVPVTKNNMSVYDRFGNLLYSEEIDFNDNNSGWDGRFNDRFVEQGVYVLIFEYQDLAGKSHTINSSVLVTR